MKKEILKKLKELYQLSMESGNSDYQAVFSTLEWVIKDDVATVEFKELLWKFVAKYYALNKLAGDLEPLRTNARLRAEMSRYLDDILEDADI